MDDYDTAVIPDMSDGGQSATVQILVGREQSQKTFTLARHLLKAKSIQLPIEAGNNIITLEDDDPETFNLFVAFLHDYRLPQIGARFPKSIPMTLQGGLDEIPGPDAILPSRMHLKESTIGGAILCYQNIYVEPAFKNFSPDEVRLADLIKDSESHGSPYHSMKSPSTNVGSSSAISSPTPAKQEPSTLCSDSFSQPAEKQKTATSISSDSNKDNAVQTSLLKLALLAEKYGWEACFNTAIDAYRHGERNMSRNTPELDHLDLVYSAMASNKWSKSAATELLTDYACFNAVATKSIRLFNDLFEAHPSFLRNFTKRLDNMNQVSGLSVLTSFQSIHQTSIETNIVRNDGPLSRGLYHVHVGELYASGVCPVDGKSNTSSCKKV